MLKIILNTTILLLLIQNCSFKEVNKKSELKFYWEESVSPINNFRYNIAMNKDSKIYVVGGDNSGAFEAYDVENKSWEVLAPLPSERRFIGGAVVEDSIYVIGGIDSSNKYSGVVDKYNITNGNWKTCNNLNVPRSRLAVVSHKGYIYAIGGMEGESDRNYKNSAIVERYHPETDTWDILTEMPTPRHGHSAIVANDKIFVIGGYVENNEGNMEESGVVEVYDPVTDKWSKRAPMPTPRGFFGAASLHGKIYAIAGRVPGDKGPIECYDYSNDKWGKLEPLSFWRNRFGITSIDNKVFIIGGENNPNSVLIGEIK